MLTPGMFNDMMELLTPRKEAADGEQNDWHRTEADW